MPKGRTQQKNKSFKGESKRKTKQKAASSLKKKIKKQEVKTTSTTTNAMQSEKTSKPKTTPAPPVVQPAPPKLTKIIAVFPMNEQSNTNAIKFNLMKHLHLQQQPTTSYETQEGFLNIPANGKLIKQPLKFIFLDRNPEQILDACKVADLVCPVLSCRDCDTTTISLDPHKNAHAFDEQGYKLLSSLRAQGLVQQVCYIQDLEEIAQGKRGAVKKLFARYFESEFPGSHIEDDIQTLLRSIVVLPPQQVEWRDTRGYMLPDDIIYINGELSIIGTWRGSQGLSANQLVHITGVDDFQIARIELLGVVEQVLEPTNPESLDPICRDKQHDIGDCDQLLKDMEGMGLQEEDENGIHEEQESDVSYEDLDKEFENEAQKKREMYEIEHRGPEDLDYEDEVEYGVEVKLRERYEKYQGLKNIRTTEFDPLTFLPDEAEKIYNFRFLKKIKQDALEEMKADQQVQPGSKIKITLLNIPPLLVQRLTQPNRICIVSGLLKHERRMTQMHVRFHRHSTHEQVIKSKHQCFIQIGFRRAHVNPIFSRILNNCSKSKYVKEVKDDQFYLASFYFYNSFPQQPVLFWQNDFEFRSCDLMGTGEISRCDTFQVILKRIVLTGYPVKINKRKAVIRLMFFNPDDVKFFRPIELSTKLGLRGNILEPLGTHGLMKCMFNNFVKPNDVVSLHLYKRVHPKFVNIQI